jgi:hypothetical protein
MIPIRAPRRTDCPRELRFVGPVAEADGRPLVATLVVDLSVAAPQPRAQRRNSVVRVR